MTARGGRREAIYEDDADREQFLTMLGDVVGGFNWRCHAYCLMSNHYHLVVETKSGQTKSGNPSFQRATCRQTHGNTLVMLWP